MKIFMACPAPAGSRKGNRVTADRWAGILKSLANQVTIGQEYNGMTCDLLIALHARKSYPAVRKFRRQNPGKPVIVTLTGTDLYREIRRRPAAQASLEAANRLIVLQRAGIPELPKHLRSKARVIYQSAERTRRRRYRSRACFDVCVLGHLRAVKDPFRTAMALRFLPCTSRIRVTHLGQALDATMEKRARALMARNGRYRWLGEVPRGKARRILAASHLTVISSQMEGGANVVSEALVDSVPVLASRISGNIGMLGPSYPGYFPVGDEQALGALLHRAETNARFYRELKRRCVRRAKLLDPGREKQAWKKLIRDLQPVADDGREKLG